MPERCQNHIRHIRLDWEILECQVPTYMRQQLAAGGHTSLPQVEDALDIPQVNKKNVKLYLPTVT